MNEISIVTAFYDIGRGDWTTEKGHPSYLFRSNDIYLERFARLCQLNTDITVFTSEELAPGVEQASKNRSNKTNIVTFDIFSQYCELYERISKIQKTPEFQSLINPNERINPEYWSPGYVLVTNLKAFYCATAIRDNLIANDMVAWIDFGYCRSDNKIPVTRKWQYAFDPEKIHMFGYKPYDGRPIKEIMANNDVFILGAKIVAHKNKWPLFEDLMFKSIYSLLEENYVDDDQGHELNSWIMNPDAFQIHPIPNHQYGHDPFVLFNEYNDCT